MSDGPKFLAPGEMTDEQLTIGEMRAFMRDSREDMRWLREELAPAIVEIRGDLALIRRHQGELEKRIAALEAAQTPTRRKRK